MPTNSGKVSLTTVTNDEGRPVLVLVSPYHPALPPRARNLGGTFGQHQGEKAWLFDPRDADRVRDLCREVYGIDPMDAPPELVTVRVHLRGVIDDASVWGLGRRLLSRSYRDSPVRLGEGVVLIEGRFAFSGGWRRKPCIGAVDGAVLEVRDVPGPLAAAPWERPYVERLEIVTDAPPGHATEDPVERAWRQLLALSAEQRRAILARLQEHDEVAHAR